MSHDLKIKAANEAVKNSKEAVKKGKFRNNYHFMPPAGWMNDPNGMIFWRGQYHMFYQHNPQPIWKSLHWGHAVSDDLISWEDLPVALAPSEDYDDYFKGGCWSGTAVDYKDELHVFYTSCIAKEGEQNIQQQSKAVSKDGISFEKSGKNPIVKAPDEFTFYDFRDPKVWIENGIWYMLCATRHGKNGCLVIFKSIDGENFDFLNIFNESDGTLGDMWECPDFFTIGDKDVFIFSPMGAKEHKTYYMVGKLDRATGKFNEEYYAPLDYGDDFYAPQTFSGIPGRTVMIGWLQPFWKDEEIPTKAEGWISSMSVPRELTLTDENKLVIKPISALNNLRIEDEALKINDETISTRKAFNIGDGLHYELELSINAEKSTAKNVAITFASGKNEVVADINVKDKTISMDITRFHDSTTRRSAMPLTSEGEIIKLHIFVDSCTLELFTSDYTGVFTKTMYPQENNSNIIMDVQQGELVLESMVAYPLKKVIE